MHNANTPEKKKGVSNRVSKTSTLINSYSINKGDPSEAEETCIDLLKDSVDKIDTDTANHLLKDSEQNRGSLRKTDEIVNLRKTDEIACLRKTDEIASLRKTDEIVKLRSTHES